MARSPQCMNLLSLIRIGNPKIPIYEPNTSDHTKTAKEWVQHLIFPTFTLGFGKGSAKYFVIKLMLMIGLAISPTCGRGLPDYIIVSPTRPTPYSGRHTYGKVRWIISIFHWMPVSVHVFFDMLVRPSIYHMTTTRIRTLLTAVVVYLSVRGGFEEKSAVVLFSIAQRPPFLHLCWFCPSRIRYP